MKRTLSLIISFVMMATMVSLPTGVFAEESITEGNEITVTETPVDNQEEQGVAEATDEMTEEDAESDVPQDSTLPVTETEAESTSQSVSSNAQEKVSIEPVTAGQVNPLYEDVVSESDIPQVDLSSQESTSARSVTYLTTEAAVASALRDKMEDRQGTITLYYQTSSYDGTSQIFYDLFDAALAHTGVPTEGDYLHWHYQGWESGLSGYSYAGVYYLTITYNVVYYTTAAQEKVVDTKVNEILSYLDLSATGKTEYLKVKSIYDYICSNVTYDNVNLNNDAYKLKYSAYAAFINKTAVCQGYALMFYRLALEAGIDARLVAGYGGGEAHGWNIVKIGSLYYNLDSTWDAGNTSENYKWFLRNSSSTSSFDATHAPYAEFNTTLEWSEHPMSGSDYVVSTPTTPIDISSWKAHLEYYRIPEDGTAKTPEVIVPGLVEGTDFDVSYSDNNVTAGNTVTVTIEGTGSYTGTITKTFYIGKGIASYASAATLSQSSYTYDGTAKTPSVTIKGLTAGTDFTISGYSRNINAGTATVTITGSGDYIGSFTKKFTIKPATLSSMVLNTTSYTYNGTYRKPTATVKFDTKTLGSGTDYTIAYSNNYYPGTAKVTVTGKGNYTGSLYKNFAITAPSVATPKTVTTNLCGYDDFIVSWSKVTVAGATVKYKVEYQQYKKGWTVLTDGTTAVSKKKTNLSDGKKYRFRITPYVTINDKTYTGKTKTSAYVYSLKKLSKPKIQKRSKTKIRVNWVNIPGETGYQVARSTKKSKGYKIVKTVKSTKTEYTNITTKRNKNYYYKVRAYKTVNGKKIYGPWSSPRKYKLR